MQSEKSMRGSTTSRRFIQKSTKKLNSRRTLKSLFITIGETDSSLNANARVVWNVQRWNKYPQNLNHKETLDADLKIQCVVLFLILVDSSTFSLLQNCHFERKKSGTKHREL